LNCDLGIKGIDISSIFNALNPLNWLMCGIVQGMDLVVKGLDSEINNYLSVGTDSTKTDNPNQIFADSNGCSNKVKAGVCNDYHDAWSQFRDIALGLLAIVGLIIVISQALGMEILDAYMIRKMLPRVLIATIAIVLSWPLMRFAVVLSNDLGYGVGNLIYGPFSGLGDSIRTGDANNLLGALAAGLGGLLLDTFGLLSFVGTAAVAVIITFLVLTLRQIVIILLIILSPIAIIAYVLPNTQRVYKFWWESFSKALLMFPLIVAFIAAGHVFSAIAASGSGFVSQVIAFIAYFGPYFAIPLTFRFAGAMMGGIGNAVNARGEGARRALAGVRSNRMKYNAGRLKAGTRFEGRIPGTSRIQDKLNETSKGIGTGFKGRFGIGKRGAIARAAAGMTAGQELLNSPAMKAIAGKNDYNRIMAEANGYEALGRERLAAHLRSGGDDGKEKLSEEQIKGRVDTAAAAAKAQGGFTRAHSLAAFYAMAQDGTAIRDSTDLGRLAAIAGNGDDNATLTAAATGSKLSRGANRPDLAVETGKIVDLAKAQSDHINKTPGRLYKGTASLDKLQFDAWKSGRGSEVGYTKMSSARSRAVRSDTRSALNVLQKHQQNLEDIKEGKIDEATGETVKPVYEKDDVLFAASALYDDRMNINQGYGRLNNKQAFAEEMSNDKTNALDSYLTLPAKDKDGKIEMKKVMKKRQVTDAAGRPAIEEYEAEEPETYEDRVKEIVGDRYANLNDEQRKAAQQRDAEEQK
jgi:hypothetical protein